MRDFEFCIQLASNPSLQLTRKRRRFAYRLRAAEFWFRHLAAALSVVAVDSAHVCWDTIQHEGG